MRQTTLLAILKDFSRWYKDHHTEDLDLQPDKWTPKLKLIRQTMGILSFLPELQQVIWSTKIVEPIDRLIRWGYITVASIKLRWFRQRGLKVVAIAGSYGKTSTKTIMAHLLGKQQHVLVTPKSINTILGIAQVILSDLKSSHQLFVVEFGEYNANDVAQLTSFTQPDFGVVTPIGRQHLERFGTLENIVKTFEPLVSFFKLNPERLLLESDNAGYFTQIAHFPTYVYDAPSTLHLSDTRLSRQGTEFIVHYPNSTQSVFMPLYGKHQAVNTLPSFWLAHHLNLNQDQVIKQAASLPYLDRRHQPHFGENNILILDNSYNTNPDAVTSSLALINQLDASRRLIITAGFVELGSESNTIHYHFGQQLAANVDYVGLVEAPWTSKIIEGFIDAGGKREHIAIGKDYDQALAKLSGMIIPNSIVLFEGGFREIYT
jgi:UDP-N-acetylmuramoyl-tripeptide--D-alanyl-D-alanine ligase